MNLVRFVTLVVGVYGVAGEYMRRELLSLNTSCPVQASCNSNGVEGVCVSRSSGCCRGTFNSANLCPGNNDIQCCYYAPCQTNHGSGTCMQTSLCHSQGGTPDSGNYCDGPADLQCCVKGSPSGKVTRDEMIARAQDWVNRRIPYSQSAQTGKDTTVLSVVDCCPKFLDSETPSSILFRRLPPRLLWYGLHGLEVQYRWRGTHHIQSAGNISHAHKKHRSKTLCTVVT